MRLGFRLLLGVFLIAGLAAYFVLSIFSGEVKPGVRQGMEVALVDTANLLAELAAEDLVQGRMAEGRLAQAVGATTVNTPTTCPSHRTGAATCMAEVLGSAGSSRVARAP